jgi:hypothetical protein
LRPQVVDTQPTEVIVNRRLPRRGILRTSLQGRENGESSDDSPFSRRFLPGAPNWTVLEKMSAGRRACAPSERPSREASARGIPKARGPMTRSIASQPWVENDEASGKRRPCS